MLKTIIRANQERQAGDPPGPVAVHPLLWRLYRGRGVDHPADVERTLPTLVPPDRMRGLDRAVEVLARALDEGQRILVIGDFDADGATSCALALTALRSFGHTAVDFLVPNRFEFGYGLTPEIVEHAKRYRPDLIVTVDNGISSVAGVAAARALGWGVVVTDHHLAGSVLPEADAIVNPNLADNPFPSKALAGVGVIFYVLLGLRSHLRASGWFERRGLTDPNMAELLDLVALGTVADVVPLDRNNRVLVHHGLQRIRGAQCRPGIAALLRVAGRDPARAQANDLGFAAGPRLNAAGRMDDMALGIRCLLADDADEAWALASALDDLNRERRSVEQDMQHQAEAMLADWGPAEAHDLPWGLCLFHEDWHQGVIGILASRIKERHHRPVIAFAAVGDGTLKGSARSIPGLHIRDALDELAVRHPELLQRFGGHAMAAGMTIEADAFDAFAQAFDTVVRRHLTADDLHAVIHSDGALAPGDLNLDTARVVLQGGPWGQGFPEPTFDDRFEVVSSRIVGERHWKLVLRVPGNDQLLDAIAFNAVQQLPQMPGAIHAAYRLEENLWQGRSSLQLRIEYLEGADDVGR